MLAFSSPAPLYSRRHYPGSSLSYLDLCYCDMLLYWILSSPPSTGQQERPLETDRNPILPCIAAFEWFLLVSEENLNSPLTLEPDPNAACLFSFPLPWQTMLLSCVLKHIFTLNIYACQLLGLADSSLLG